MHQLRNLLPCNPSCAQANLLLGNLMKHLLIKQKKIHKNKKTHTHIYILFRFSSPEEQYKACLHPEQLNTDPTFKQTRQKRPSEAAASIFLTGWLAICFFSSAKALFTAARQVLANLFFFFFWIRKYLLFFFCLLCVVMSWSKKSFSKLHSLLLKFQSCRKKTEIFVTFFFPTYPS